MKHNLTTEQQAEQVADRLEYYNSWRRGEIDANNDEGDYIPNHDAMPDPKTLGEDIDTAVRLLRLLAIKEAVQ